MAERAGDPDALGRLGPNRPVLARLAEGAIRSRDGLGPWSPDGWVMGTPAALTRELGSSDA